MDYFPVCRIVLNTVNVMCGRGLDWAARQKYGQCVAFAKEMQLAVNIFNVSTSGAIFGLELLCLSAGTVGMYFFVRLALHQPLVVILMFFILLFNGITFYSVMWDNVFVIPETMDQIRRDLSQKLHKTDRHLARKLIKSIGCVAVRVGNFRQMERNSTLLFLDFVVFNTANLLISF